MTLCPCASDAKVANAAYSASLSSFVNGLDEQSVICIRAALTAV